MLDASPGARPRSRSSSPSTTSPMPKPSAGRSTPPSACEQAVVASAAADGAQRPAGVEQLEHGAGVVRQAAHDGEIDLDELAQPHRAQCVRPPAGAARRPHVPPGTAASAASTAGRPSSEAISKTPLDRPAPTRRPRPAAPPAPPARTARSCPPPGRRRRAAAPSTPGAEQQDAEHPAVGEPHAHVRRPEPEGAHHVQRQGDDLGVAERPGLADQIAVELEVLSKPPPLLPLVAEELRDGEPADRLLEPVGARGHHAGERGRHLRPQRDLAAALVGEVVELPDDLVAALGRVQLERLERRAVVLLEPVPGRHGPPGPEDVGAQGEIGGVKLAKARQGLGLHGENIAGGRDSRRLTPPPCRAPPSRRRRCGTSRSPAPSPRPAAPSPAPRRNSGTSVQEARAGGRPRSRSQRRSQTASHPRLAAVGATVRTPRSMHPVELTSISGHSLSPRIETSACSGRGGRSVVDRRAPARRMPSGLWATSNSHLPRRSSRPGTCAPRRSRASTAAERRAGRARAAP